MAKFYKYYPKTEYYIDEDSSSVDTLTNLTTFFSFEQDFKNNSVVFNKYSIQENETPEILAHKFYGSSEKHWIILLMNDIVNPLSDWPLPSTSLEKYIDVKYRAASYANNSNVGAGTTWARTNTYGYFVTESKKNSKNEVVDSVTYQVNAATYANTSTNTSTYTLRSGDVYTFLVSKETKTYYQYEDELNESKREIKILKPDFVGTVDQEFRNIMT
jgi:hypothetical protein